jgi:hypothetical protein
MTDLKPMTDAEVRQFVEEWYRLLDVHAPVDRLLPLLADADLEMRLPEVTSYGHDGFKQWYAKVTNRFFDEVHTIKELEMTDQGDRPTLRVVVNWQAKIWNPPAAKSEWVGFDAGQTWVLSRSTDTGKPVIVQYSVDTFDPMEGSATL